MGTVELRSKEYVSCPSRAFVGGTSYFHISNSLKASSPRYHDTPDSQTFVGQTQSCVWVSIDGKDQKDARCSDPIYLCATTIRNTPRGLPPFN